MRPPLPAPGPVPLPPGGQKGSIRKLTFRDLYDLLLTNEWQFIDRATVIAATPTYTMAAVESGTVRLIIDAHAQDTSVAGTDSYVDIHILTADNLIVPVAMRSSIPPAAGIAATAECRAGLVVLRAGESLVLNAQTELIDGCIRYIDVWMGG